MVGGLSASINSPFTLVPLWERRSVKMYPDDSLLSLACFLETLPSGILLSELLLRPMVNSPYLGRVLERSDGARTHFFRQAKGWGG